jgi:hypothetical protein
MLNSFNTLKTQLTADDVSAILGIVGKRCREKTLRRLRSILTYSPSSIPVFGIFERLTKTESGEWEYCAGQSYPDEIRTLRDCILNK